MATDYRFAIQCWQDSAGSENAKANIFVNDTQVATEVEITATSADSPQTVSFEVTGLSDPNADGSVTCDIKVSLINDYYVDSSTDRNIWINSIAHICKYDSSPSAIASDQVYLGEINQPVTDFTNIDEYVNRGNIPTAVTGDQLPDNFWDDALSNNQFYYIPVWGNPEDSNAGVTITWKLTPEGVAP